MEFKFRYEKPATGGALTWGKFLVAKLNEDIAVIVAGKYLSHRNIPTGVSQRDLIGAGKFDRTGKITEWGSEGYHITTPEVLRPEIEKVFAANKDHIVTDVWPKAAKKS